MDEIRESAPESIRDRLTPLGGEPFRFACHPDVPCFTECCRDLQLMLTPYDILRSKKALQLSADAFLDRYAEIRPDAQGKIPMVYLKMRDDERRTCPFVTPRGCGIYEHRPSACRIYPLARASRRHRVHGTAMESYFLLREDHCRGFDQDRKWTVEQWIADQGLDPYHRMNDQWMDVVTRIRSGRGLTQRQAQMFYMASYDVERFRSFVLETRFARLFDLAPKDRNDLARSDQTVLDLAFRWLRFSLLQDQEALVPSTKAAPGT